MRQARRPALLAALSLVVAGCASTAEELRQVGKPPALTAIENPAMAATGRRQVVVPMPEPEPQVAASNSLWRSGARQFFNDPRAARVGDILTVSIQIDDRAQLNNSTNRNRASSKEGGVTSFFGLEQAAQRILPGNNDLGALVGAESSGTFSGSGGVQRQERVELTVAAMVTQVLPNGNLVVAGRQEVRVNNEVRELLVSGIVRTQDISASNRVLHTQMAEARISYGGRGQITAFQQPPRGQQVIEALSPF
jgi:flagellar L-ring protein precursor FlgH